MHHITLLAPLFLAATLSAQITRSQDIPLKNWPAPLYWQPSQAEMEHSPLRAELRDPSPKATTPAGALVFVAMPPCRVVDTRSNCSANPNLCGNAQFGPPSLATNTARNFPIQLSPTCSIPATAMAYSCNVTMIPNPPGSFAGYLTIWNTTASPNTPPAAASILDFPTSDIRSNAVIVPAGISNGSISVITNATNPLDVAVDVNGYYAPLTGITLAQGTASAPSLSFSGDAGTGMFSSGTRILNFAVGGRAAMTIDGGFYNTALGVGALAVNTGLFNTAIGSFALSKNTTGESNTASGESALSNNTTGSANTGSGHGTLFNNTIGAFNTATGNEALYYNSTGNNNTATGYRALWSTTVDGNTATGYEALYSSTIGTQNTANGLQALYSNTTAGNNTATGYFALYKNTTAGNNTATGTYSLYSNTTGGNNTAQGNNALWQNTTGSNNNAVGDGALYNNTMGSENIGVGRLSLGSNTTGNNNVAIGNSAGSNVTTTSNNIHISHVGVSGDSGVIRIGTAGAQNSFYAAGIAGAMVSGPTVLVDTTTGQLGTVSSSRRYKEDIHDMSDSSSGLFKLRPVTFRYQKPYANGSKPLDYGLIAEEVADVYPDLIVKNNDGQVESVQYHKLIPMLLNELQKLKAEVAELKTER